uniref:Putative BEL1-like homeodomain protein 11 n=1 Tax=Davidia involucrata TaxID=16924 RepID=A0A5B7C6C8_DAVIN
MVSPQNPASSIFHQFIFSDSMGSQNQHFDSYRSDFIDLVKLQPPPISDESEINHSRHLNDQNQYRQSCLNSNLMEHFNSGEEACNLGVEGITDEYGPFVASSSISLNQSFAIAVGSWKYLKPAQSLLQEVVHVGGKTVDLSNEKYVRRLSCNSRRGSLQLKAELCNHGLSAKTAKLIGLLEEVERGFEQYYHHMELVVSSFEVIAGLGAANSYTALVLQAMSRHFCGLRDAIISQINMSKRKFAQDLPRINMGLSQLSLFDRESGHNRLSLQQLGMIQSQRQAWRPIRIRGLPETSVAILRSWLFQHFLHPYPNDSEKLMLASQTGLTKNQVSNWFINARVRLWKPMIEEMYREEFADSSDDSNPYLATSSYLGGN